ncbi:aminopeptidase I zinc metalloprotease-domain-containing protein [Limtongia smithiae]|uniref:aminopeptidase I zinc metalloprotease-domain-containing protein n=1 Tax=Limtongia smithiae TaxID=1125753 RepID=UPI0034CD7512
MRVPTAYRSAGGNEPQPQPFNYADLRAAAIAIPVTAPQRAVPAPAPTAAAQQQFPGLAANVMPPVEQNTSYAYPQPERVTARAPSSAAMPIDPYTSKFIDFIYENPTTYHAASFFADEFTKAGFTYLSERVSWTNKLTKGGKYFTTRNGSSLVAFVVGGNYVGGNGAGMVACHIDALTAKVKPISKKVSVEGYTQLGAAPYAGAMSSTWWDRDLGVSGRVVVKQADTGVIQTKLFTIPYPIARIPTLAPHFGTDAAGPFNAETNTTPIIGLEPDDPAENELRPEEIGAPLAGRHNIRLLRLIAGELGVPVKAMLNCDLELFDTQKGTVGGLDKELLFCPRIDDKICAFAAVNGLLNTCDEFAVTGSGMAVVALFDDEEIGSLLRQGARGGLLEGCISRVVDALGTGATMQQTYANSFLVSADVLHAVNPNFMYSYMQYHMPHLNVGVAVACDPNGHMTSDAESIAFMEEIARRSNNTLQYFQIRNDSRSGGTVGPMLSSSMGCRSIDMGIPQLAMHSIRACTGSKDVMLGVKIFQAFFEEWEDVDYHFRAGEKM